MQQEQTCALCGGRLEEDTVRHAVTYRNHVIVFTDVPARVCRQCGEPFFAGAVVDEMNRFAWALVDTSTESSSDLAVFVHRVGETASATPVATATP